MSSQIDQVRSYLKALQNKVTDSLEAADGAGHFTSDEWSHESGGGGCTMVLDSGQVFGQAGVNYSEVNGDVDLRWSIRWVSAFHCKALQ